MECRLCFCDEHSTENPLVSPCNCRGSLKYIHRQCLYDLRKSNATTSTSCPTCKTSYKFVNTSLSTILLNMGNKANIVWGIGVMSMYKVTGSWTVTFIGSRAIFNLFKVLVSHETNSINKLEIFLNQCTSMLRLYNTLPHGHWVFDTLLALASFSSFNNFHEALLLSFQILENVY